MKWAAAILKPLQANSQKVSYESPVLVSDLCDIDDDGRYAGRWPTPLSGWDGHSG